MSVVNVLDLVVETILGTHIFLFSILLFFITHSLCSAIKCVCVRNFWASAMLFAQAGLRIIWIILEIDAFPFTLVIPIVLLFFCGSHMLVRPISEFCFGHLIFHLYHLASTD